MSYGERRRADVRCEATLRRRPQQAGYANGLLADPLARRIFWRREVAVRKWTLGLLLVAAAGCGYPETRMVACPGAGCSVSYAEQSPEGLPATRHVANPTAIEKVTVKPLPDPSEPAPVP